MFSARFHAQDGRIGGDSYSNDDVVVAVSSFFSRFLCMFERISYQNKYSYDHFGKH